MSRIDNAKARIAASLDVQDETPETSSMSWPLRVIAAGALAGTTVDLALFPLDTLKTRLQSSAGFFGSGGFRGVYSGLASVVVGSAPGAGLFFISYESTKSLCSRLRSSSAAESSSQASRPVDLMLAASLGEVAACAVRVPTEVIKQRAQAQRSTSSAMLLEILRQRSTIGWSGIWLELYRGWTVTIMREVPFTMIQFPLWEGMKRAWKTSSAVNRTPRGNIGDTAIEARYSAIFGAIAGAIAAAATTPLDVLKTRMMLARGAKIPVWTLARQIYRKSGTKTFFAGVTPRVVWISAGGAVFLGTYEWARNLLAVPVI